MEVHQDWFSPQWRNLFGRALLRTLQGTIAAEYNRSVLEQAKQFKPAILLAFKGQLLRASTLRELRTLGIRLYNYYPDNSAYDHGDILLEALPEYDCIFYTKRFWDKDVRQHITLRESVYLPHGHDPEVHKPQTLSPRDLLDFSCDVALIANFSRHKGDLLDALIRLRPQLDLRIWGHNWERSGDPQVLRHWAGYAVTGQQYAIALQAIRINLGIMSGVMKGTASMGDQTTTRTYEIPACGGFMLHERNAEVLELFREGAEIACFDGAEELAEKIDYYLAHSEERTTIALAGHKRCVPAYSYDQRMAELLQWHRKRFPDDKTTQS